MSSACKNSSSTDEEAAQIAALPSGHGVANGKHPRRKGGSATSLLPGEGGALPSQGATLIVVLDATCSGDAQP